MTPPPTRQQGVDAPAQLRHLGLVRILVGVGKLDDVEPLQILAGHILDEILHRVPDDVGASQSQHPGVHRLHRQGVGLYHKGGVSERGGEAVVLDVDERAVARDGVMLSRASVMKPKEPSEPHSTRLTSRVSLSG